MAKGLLKGALARYNAKKPSKAKPAPTPSQKKKTAPLQASQKFQPFSPKDRVILIGEGDFSFAVSVIKSEYLKPENIIATSYDSFEDLKQKYFNTVEENVEYLTSKGVTIMYKVDCQDLVSSLNLTTRITKHKSKNKSVLNGMDGIDCIVFNFPHTGKGIKDMERNIAVHQDLVLKFFQSCKAFFELLRNNRGLLSSDTKSKDNVLMALFDGEPYDSWDVRKIAKTNGFKAERSGKFCWDLFPGYKHRRTNGGLKETSTPSMNKSSRLYLFKDGDAV